MAVLNMLLYIYFSSILSFLILENEPVSENSEGVQEREHSRTSSQTGKYHHNKPPILKCTECGELVCQHCSLNDHEHHNCELMEKTSPEDKAKLLTDKQSLEVLQEELAKARKKIHALEVENQKLASIKYHHTKFKELYNILEQCMQELGEHATTIGITANSKKEILVALSRNATKIVKIDIFEGKRVDLVEKSDLVGPCYIACDEEDNIYCVDGSSNKILTCNDNGDKLIIHEVELEKDSSGRSTLAITDQKLFMAEYGHASIIKVYNKQLQHLSTIKHGNMNITDITVDVHQNLYVSDWNNSCIHVFTKDGIHLRSIGHDKEELKEPNCLCVHGQYVYVTDVTSHCVFVFTTDGEYVISFGQRGPMEEDVNWPSFIYVHSNGFIDVTDFSNN